MIIIGAKGFAKEVLEVFHSQNKLKNLVFFDNISTHVPEFLFGHFPVLKNENEVKDHFKAHGTQFALGLGNPKHRFQMAELLKSWGGELTSVISDHSEIGNYDISIGDGCNILPNSIIANGSQIGQGCIIYYNTIVTHDCIVGDFAELSPGATLLGGCKIGNFSKIGSNATIFPGIQIGENAVIGAGAVVKIHVPDNATAVGVPARVLKSKTNG
jgi:sugar O-acyltransferase (sialic acid O-acetyltransferase NeuD family)